MKDPIEEAKLIESYIGSYQKGMLVGSRIGSCHDPIESAQFQIFWENTLYSKLNVHYNFTEMNF